MGANNSHGYGVTFVGQNITKPLGGNTTFNIGAVSYEDNVFTIECKETMQHWGYSLETGELLGTNSTTGRLGRIRYEQ